ncbi:hypothetical protein [Solidesulfovibrio sp. C21]|uniref:hypothetical protein n=1 Tax=Solidesulfovibrio sp. C21 TaxID=3398613 RepID=UPI0039FD91D5
MSAPRKQETARADSGSATLQDALLRNLPPQNLDAEKAVLGGALDLGRRDLVALVEDAGRDIRRHIEDFPAVAALLWAIAHCDERKPALGRTETRSGTADKVAGY